MNSGNVTQKYAIFDFSPCAGPATDSCWFMPLRLPTGEWITPGRFPFGVMMFFFTASATVSERNTWFTACSKCSELMRFTPLRKIEIMALLNLDAVA